MAKGISETAFASQIESLLNIYGWRWMHPRPARVRRGGKDVYETAYSGHKGFLDYVAVRMPRLLFFELKDEKRAMTPEQEAWFEDLSSCQLAVVNEPLEVKGNKATVVFGMNAVPAVILLPEVYLWRPSQFDEVKEILSYGNNRS